MSCSTIHQPSPSTSTSTQKASAFSHPSSVMAAIPEPKNTSILWPPSRHNTSLHPLPEETQQDEIFNVWTVNYCNLDDDARVAIKYPDPERCVVLIGEPEIAKEEHAIVEELMGDFQSPVGSSSASSTTLSLTTAPPSYESLSPPQSSSLGHTQLEDQPATHTAPQSTGPQPIPSPLAPCRTMEPAPRMGSVDDGSATTIKPESSTRTSSQYHKPRSNPIPRPSIDLKLAGYNPRSGPSPLLADQAAAQQVYRAVKQHISDQLKSHAGVDCTRAAERQQARACLKLAALNAAAAQDFRAAEQALGITPGKGGRGRGLVRRTVFDNSAWQPSPNGHARQSSLLTEYQPNRVVEAVQRQHRGRRTCASSIESVCGSSSRSRSYMLQSHTPVPTRNGSAAGSGSSGDSNRLEGYYARPRRSNVPILIISS